jgi:hypothetical protein
MERHDIVNAVLLAGVILLLGFGIVTAADRLFQTVDEGLVVTEKAPVIDDEGGDSTPGSGTAQTDTTAVPSEDEVRPAAEVTVRVGNGARRPGVAGAGTETLQAAGYTMLAPKNGPTVDDSVVYYTDSFQADAVRIADLLGVETGRVEPMPDNPGVPVENANVIVILGVNSSF